MLFDRLDVRKPVLGAAVRFTVVFAPTAWVFPNESRLSTVTVPEQAPARTACASSGSPAPPSPPPQAVPPCDCEPWRFTHGRQTQEGMLDDNHRGTMQR